MTRRSSWDDTRKRRRAQLLERDPDPRCAYCHVPLAMRELPETMRACMCDGELCHVAAEGRQGATIDHVVPLARGGTNDLDNLVWACNTCNASKGAR